jgi:alpha-L-fucosidase 2
MMKYKIYKKGLKTFLCLLFYFVSVKAICQVITHHSYASTLWYNHPAINWNEALPVGNGRLGAMIYGGAKTEHLQLNEQTLWSGGPRNWNNPRAKDYLPLVREAALKGEYRKADSLSKFMQGPYTESYMPMADLFVAYDNINDSGSYHRSLNIDSAVNQTRFVSSNITYTRTIFSSFPDQVIVFKNSADKKGRISFTAALSSKLHYTVSRIAPNHLVLRGKCPLHVEPVYLWRIKDKEAIQYAQDEKGEGMTFEVHLYIKNEGGSVQSDNNTITVKGADAATFVISAATSYNGYDKSPGLEGKNPSVDALKYLIAAIAKPYTALLKRHVDDYQPIFRRVHYFLGESRNKLLPTDERLKLMKSYTDPELVALIAQFGRYILIAGSRPGGQPVNLKGIWNDRLRPEYSSNWCIDHDAQMFYYAVETSNLSEMHLPFLEFIKGLSDNGKNTAAVNYGMKGWCAHHNTDIWRQTGPAGNWGEGNPHWATWNMSGAWLSAHLFDHYLFTGDKKFLQAKAWPIMKGAAEYCLDWLLERNGKLISVPSVSPENTFITERNDTAQISVNTTSDIALIKELFRNCITAGTILKTDDAFTGKLKIAMTKLMPYTIGSKGQLLEWAGEWRPVDPSHRHISHMYPVFPGGEISPLTDTHLADAAKIALSLREKTNCSWGFAWKAACWARLGEADSAWQTWQYQLQYVNPESKSSLDNYGLFPNLFNSDGADVIMNGNGCATAVLTEMLMQSQTGVIDLLPAIPSLFPEGRVSGLCARGGFVINFSWGDKKIRDISFVSKLGNDCRLRNDGMINVSENSHKVNVEKSGDELYVFKTQAGHTYNIRVD